MSVEGGGPTPVEEDSTSSSRSSVKLEVVVGALLGGVAVVVALFALFQCKR